MEQASFDPFVFGHDVLLRLVLSVVFAGLIGWEREWRRKPAGLRTHMMVSLGAASFTLVALELYESVVTTAASVSRADPLRIVEGVMGGIGFLGAGAIVQGRGFVEGLTTAGSIWLAGAIGVACGGGHLLLAGTSVALALLVLLGLGLIERWLQEGR